MKKNVFFIAAIAALMSACSSDYASEFTNNDADSLVTVTVGFGGFTMQPMTRATQDVADVCTHLDVWISDGTTTTAYNQASGDTGFGTLTMTLNLTKTYTLYAVAHRGSGAATLADGVISFADDKVTHTFFVSRTFTPTMGMSLDLTMNRIVAQFQFNTTDQKPDWCKTIRFTINGVFDRWNVVGYGVHELNRVSNINISSTNQDGTITCNVYAIVTSESTNHDILVEALNENSEVQEFHQFHDVPLRNNYRTIATGNFFTDAASSFSFQAEDWSGDVHYAF